MENLCVSHAARSEGQSSIFVKITFGYKSKRKHCNGMKFCLDDGDIWY